MLAGAAHAETDPSRSVTRRSLVCEAPYIFEAFRQSDSRLARRHSGAGLGLAIAQGLAEVVDGQVTVETAPGAGATFTLTMPVLIPSHA